MSIQLQTEPFVIKQSSSTGNHGGQNDNYRTGSLNNDGHPEVPSAKPQL